MYIPENTSEILSKKYDENYINRKIEEIYAKEGLNKPKILVFDTLSGCKLAYKLVLSHLYNNSKNLTDEHTHISYNNDKIKINKDIAYLNEATSYIVDYYKNINDYSYLLEIKTQFLKDFKPKEISKENWNFASEETKNFQREKSWNNIINSTVNLFEFDFNLRNNLVYKDGIFSAIFLKSFCILCKNPKHIEFDEKGLIHSIKGSSIKFDENNSMYFIHGVILEKGLFEKIFIKKDMVGSNLINIGNNEQLKVILPYLNKKNILETLSISDILKIKDRQKISILMEYIGEEKIKVDIKVKDLLHIKFSDVERYIVNIIGRDLIKAGLTGNEIVKIKNVEIRSILIQAFGYDKLIKELKARLIDVKDEFNDIDNLPVTNELWEFDMNIRGRLQKFRFVKTQDWSTRKDVCLGVPVEEGTNTVMGAVAWTYRMTEEEYKVFKRT